MALCEKILLAGFSGSGKTSLLQKLEASAPEGWVRFDDLDQLILRAHGRGALSLTELIDRDGWEKFRLWERQQLEGWLKEDGRGVLSLGAGTLSPQLIEMLSPIRKVRILHLEAEFETCWKRLVSDQERVITQKGKSELRKIFQVRQQNFSRISWKLVNEEGKDLDLLAEEFWRHLETG